MSSLPDTPSIPRLKGENDKNYSARVKYLLMGKDRSLSSVADWMLEQSGEPPGFSLKTSNRRVCLWSSKFKWREAAIKYDEELAAAAAAQHRKEYLEDVEKHRRKYKKAGEELFQVANLYMARIALKVAEKDKDGKPKLSVPTDKIPNDLKHIASTFAMAADFEAHALKLREVFQRIESQDAD